MKREIFEKIILTVILTAWWLWLPMIGYTQADADNLWPHLAYMWSHANFWHLAGNLFVLWLMRRDLYLAPAFVIAFYASYIPAFSIYGDMGMTLGFSGVIFAIWGIKWGVYSTKRYGRYFSMSALQEFAKKALPFALIGIVIPHVNWCIHLYTLLAGYIYGRSKRS